MRHTFIIAGLTIIAGIRPVGAAEMRTKPNILFLITDQQTVSALGCAGNPYVKTPNLDRLAARGVRFTESYACYPLCSPSRAGIFSSRMPHELGIYGNNQGAELAKKGVPTLGGLFQVAGYETAYAGKWHAFSAFPAYVGAAVPGFTVLPLAGKDPRNDDKQTAEKAPECDPYIADAAVKFLQRPHAKPFLLVVSLLNPHDICEFNEFAGFQKMLPADPAQLPPLRPNLHDPDKLPSELQKEVRKRVGWTDLKWRQYLWVYYRLVESSDKLMGRVLDALDQAGWSSNTMVLFTSDHGEMMGSHQLVTKDKLYEESVAVPLIIAPPAATPGVDRPHLVSGLDLMPTFLDYAGITAPASLEGRSLRPLVAGETVPWRDFIVAETFGPEARMVRTSRYKYILFAQGERREQFFDMGNDPGETKNLIDNAAVAGEAARHRALLQGWMRTTGDISGKGTQELDKVNQAKAINRAMKKDGAASQKPAGKNSGQDNE